MTDLSAAIGLGPLRAAPPGLPEPSLTPPVVAESGDPFTALRVICLLARIPRGEPVRIADVAARLDANHLDWLFPERVVADVVLQVAANWGADFRTTTGFVVETGPAGAAVVVEDSARMDPWIVRQAQRQAAACLEALRSFSRRDRPSGDG